MWHPNYSAAWNTGGCTLKADCDSPGYSTQLECCQAAFGGQISGTCIKGLPTPPTFSPTTAAGAAGKWYAEQGPAWSNGGCTNTVPYPIYATVFFDTQLLCCKGAFGGQMSGACMKGLPNPPTAAPTTTGGVGGKWYADYDTSWSKAGCKNTTPYPIYAGTFYDSQLLCCKGAFAGQPDNACLQKLANPPTAAPTNVADLNGGWYADYSTSWSNAGCTNTLPRPSFAIIIYDTQLACCKGAFGGQTNEACIKNLPNPPTMKPTPTPTSYPTRSPTASPTSKPTMTPTASPTKSPTMKPTAAPFVWPVSTFLAASPAPPAPQAQWYYSAMAGGATATLVSLQNETQGGISNTLVSGAPGSIASALRLYTRPLENSDRAEVGIAYNTGLFNGMKFKDMVAGGITFEYSFFKATVSGGNEPAAPAIKVVVLNPAGGFWTTFVYEPYLNGPSPSPTKDIWQSKIADTTTGTSTTLTANSGGVGWRQTYMPPYKNSECRSLATWADYFNTNMTDIFKDAIVWQVSIGVGTYNPGVTSYVNSLRIAVGDYDWKWTFGL